MSGGSIGTIAGAVVGGIVGFFAGGNVLLGMQLGATIGGGVGTALDPPKGPNGTGPRLNDLTVQTATYGATIPRVYGTLAVFGNVFWLENNQIKEVATTESLGGKGMGGMMGGGGETTTYSYFATFALGLCEGPIIGIRRIWIGPKLFYDIGSDDTSALIASKANEQYFRLYLGDDTQTADPRMQATLGAANVPGYRGRAYIVFYDLPLADYGNTLMGAQIKVEVVKEGTLDYILEKNSSTETNSHLLAVAVNEAGSRAYVTSFDGAKLEVFDTSNKSAPVLIGETTTRNYPLDIDIDGRYAYVLCWGTNYLQVYDITISLIPQLMGEVFIGSQAEDLFYYQGHVYVDGKATNEILVYDVSDPTSPALANVVDTGGLGSAGTDRPRGFNIVGDYGYGVLSGTRLLQIYGANNPPFLDLVSETDIDNGEDPSDLVILNGYVYIVGWARYMEVYDVSDVNAPVYVATVDFGVGTGGREKFIEYANGYLMVGQYDALLVYSLDDPALPAYIGTKTYNNALQKMAVRGNHIYLGTYNGAASYLHICFFLEPTIAPTGVPLSEIVSAETLQSNLLEAADIDVTSLTPIVRGYRISEVGAIRAGIEPLRAAWPFDVVMHGYTIKYVLRGTASIATISDGELDAREAGVQPGVQITNSREMDYILPRKVSIKHFDVNREYDTGNQSFERINTDSVNVLDLELSIVLNAQEAAQKAQVLLYLYWMERYDIAFKLPPDYSELEPADVITITAADATYELRLTSISYTADGRLECRAKYNAAALYTSVAVGEEGQSTGVTLSERGDTVFALLDIPMLQDVYDLAGFPVAMTGTLSGWPGGVLYRSSDGGQVWEALQGFSPPGSTMGYAVTALPTHEGTVLDKSSLLTVRMFGIGTLASVTEAQMFTGQNWFAYGIDGRWEIIACQNCVLQGDGSYILSDFLRGQMGTEWAAGLHVAGDLIVHLSSSEMKFIVVDSTSIGVEKIYRAVTGGETLDSASDFDFSYDGVNLECLSPCHLTGSRHPSTNDWTLTWKRRSRYAGWRNYIDAPLGEDSESYEIEIYSSNTYATLKRTLAASSETVAYTSAQQVTDFGSNQGALYLKIYQLSATVGRGYPLTTSITR